MSCKHCHHYYVFSSTATCDDNGRGARFFRQSILPIYVLRVRPSNYFRRRGESDARTKQLGPLCVCPPQAIGRIREWHSSAKGGGKEGSKVIPDCHIGICSTKHVKYASNLARIRYTTSALISLAANVRALQILHAASRPCIGPYWPATCSFSCAVLPAFLRS